MSADGIGAYFAPDTFRPISPGPQAVRIPMSGLGAYYSPVSTMPVNPPQPINTPLRPMSGFGLTEQGKSQAGMLILIGILFIASMYYVKEHA